MLDTTTDCLTQIKSNRMPKVISANCLFETGAAGGSGGEAA